MATEYDKKMRLPESTGSLLRAVREGAIVQRIALEVVWEGTLEKELLIGAFKVVRTEWPKARRKPPTKPGAKGGGHAS